MRVDCNIFDETGFKEMKKKKEKVLSLICAYLDEIVL